VPLPAEHVRLLVAHSGVRRQLVEVGYGERVAECRAALAAARAAGVRGAALRALRDLGADDLPSLERALEPRLLRRARHVVTENARVDEVCAALRDADWARAGALLRDGQRSLREDFEVSTPELDLLCEAADALPGVFGSRLTGAGFGGCTLHLVAPEASGEAAAALADAFEKRFGRRPPVWQVAAGDGAEAFAPGRARE
jgi:galactokinase